MFNHARVTTVEPTNMYTVGTMTTRVFHADVLFVSHFSFEQSINNPRSYLHGNDFENLQNKISKPYVFSTP